MIFTIAQITDAHNKVKSGADFPAYIQEIKRLGVNAFETWVVDSHTVYYGNDDFSISSDAQYGSLAVQPTYDSIIFEKQLQLHQQGETDYYTFCQDCARAGVEKWVMDLDAMTCSYFDTAGQIILSEQVPQ